MAAPLAETCIREGCRQLTDQGKFLVYGPFNYDGQYTSDSNRQFDQWLKEMDDNRGIRDHEWVVEQFARQHRQLLADHEMPANNRLLVFGRD